MKAVRSLLLAGLLLVPALAALPGAPPAQAQAPKADALCSPPYHVAAANWTFCWQLDELRVQGLELNDVRYEGKRVFWKVGLPFAITRYHAYSFGIFKDTLGNSFAAGLPGFGQGALPIPPATCPRWLAHGVLLDEGRVCLETIGGPNPRVAAWSHFDIFNYRFINGYVLHADGTFEPKLLLGGLLVDGHTCDRPDRNGCVAHFHHAYWRFDLDVDGAANDTVQQFHRGEAGTYVGLPIEGHCRHHRGGPWCNLTVEGGVVRDPAMYTKWRVVDPTSRNVRGNARSFELIPASQGPPDGASSADVWAFAYKGDSAEIGYEVPPRPRAVLGDEAIWRYANGESVADADVVLWYAEHVFHEPRDEELPTMMWHTVGPRLAPRNFLDYNTLENTYT